MHNKRPVFLNLLKIRLPVAGVASFAHRVSGVLLFLLTPLALYLLDLSLRGPEGFARAAALLDAWPLRLALLVGAWALAHHLFAGIRFLLIDLDLGLERTVMRRTAWAVNLAGVAVVVLAAGGLLL
jgi:succinate dehydrogenase / fumarate reductase cytochrome b subunit